MRARKAQLNLQSATSAFRAKQNSLSDCSLAWKLVGGVGVSIGSALQARGELAEYEDIYERSKANEVTGHAVRFTIGAGRWANPLLWPSAVRDLLRLLRSSKQTVAWATRARAHDPEKRTRALIALRKARNWLPILLGSIVVFAAAALDLAYYRHEH